MLYPNEIITMPKQYPHWMLLRRNLRKNIKQLVWSRFHELPPQSKKVWGTLTIQQFCKTSSWDVLMDLNVSSGTALIYPTAANKRRNNTKSTNNNINPHRPKQPSNLFIDACATRTVKWNSTSERRYWMLSVCVQQGMVKVPVSIYSYSSMIVVVRWRTMIQ